MSESDKKTEQGKNKARRTILKTLVTGGSALTAAKVTPDQWIKPVVESVIIPSHAQTTGGGAGNPAGGFAAAGVVVDNYKHGSGELFAREDISDELLEFFMPSAQAGGCPSNSACSADFALDISNSSVFVCAFGGDVGGAIGGLGRVDLMANPPQIFGPINVGSDFTVESGEFVGSAWELDIRNNVGPSNSTTLVRFQPGVGCQN